MVENSDFIKFIKENASPLISDVLEIDEQVAKSLRVETDILLLDIRANNT